MKNKFMRILALGGALCVPAFGHAATAQAALQDLHFELIDLAPDDGLAPTLVWDFASAGADASSAYGSSLSLAADGTWSVAFSNSGEESTANTDSFQSLTSASFAGAMASVAAGGLNAQFQTHATGSFDSASSFAYGAFTLSKMTELRITGNFSLAIEGPSGDAFAVPPGSPADYAVLHAQSSAYAEVALYPSSGSASFESASLNGENYTFSTQSSLPVGRYDTNSLLSFSLQLLNDSEAVATGEFLARTVASGQQIVSPSTLSPVPELPTWLTMCVGLAMAGVWRQRSMQS